MVDPRRYLAQASLYALFFLPVVYFTQQPVYTHLDPGDAVLKIAVRHAGRVIGECAPAPGAQHSTLPPNMRPPQICPRERSPIRLQLRLNGDTFYSATVPASGVHNDGVSSMYQRFTLPAGKHQLELLMNDDVATEGPTWQLRQDIELQPAQVMVATFKEGFRVQ